MAGVKKEKKKIDKFGNREGNYKWFGFPGVWEAEKQSEVQF